MSIWASIPGKDPVFYETIYGETEDPNGWMDVATCEWVSLARIIVRSSDGEGVIVVDPAGLTELHRRIVRARIEIDRKALWREQ